MRFVIFTEPQLGASYGDQLRLARQAEELGFDAYFRSDHYLTMGGDRLPEHLAIVTGLWRTPVGDSFTFRGGYYDVVDSPGLPKPVQQPGPPVIIGGKGPRRTPQLAAKYADEFNVPFATLEQTREMYDRVAQACAEEGRDADGRAPLVLSVAQTVACGRTEAEAGERAEVTGGPPPPVR